MLSLNALSEIPAILHKSKVIAVVGFSPKSGRPSHMVGCYLLEAGYKVIPVNPGHDEICGQTCYPRLADIEQPIDLVDIFRRSDQVMPIVEEAIDCGVKTIWMQQGIVNEEAAEIARKAGLDVIMDRCIKIDHSILTKEK
ncbi:MAG: CoA-binding protein [Thermodesulfobacteriota bacterium]